MPASTVVLLVLLVLLEGVTTPADAWGWIKHSLFDRDPNVFDLSSTALRHVHADANRCPWFILFYDAMCGHCRTFAPQLSEYVSVRLQTAQHEKHRSAEEDVQGGSTQQHFRRVAVGKRAEDVAEGVAAEATMGDDGDQSTVPVLFGAINCASAEEACAAMNISGVPVLLAAEPSSALRGTPFDVEPLHAEALSDPSVRWFRIEDRHNLSQEVDDVVRRVDLSHREAATCTGLREYLTAAKSRAIERASAVLPKSAMVSHDLKRDPHRHTTRPDLAAHDAHAEEAAAAERFIEERRLFQQDVAGAFFESMWHEVAMSAATDSKEGLAALHSFLGAVDATLPELNAHYLLAQLRSSGDDDVKHVLRQHSAWKHAVKHAAIPYRGTETAVEWRTCRGSSWRERGLPCGLWSLYHAMVANAPTGEGKRTLDAIRGYVAHFFVCYECRQHFGQLLYELSDDASDEDAMLWLWRAHNQVNARLAQEGGGSSDPKVPKVQWPTTADCPACFDAQEGTFHPSAVAAFLQRHYSAAALREEKSNYSLDKRPAAADRTSSASGSEHLPGLPTSRFARDAEQRRQAIMSDAVEFGSTASAFLLLFVSLFGIAYCYFRSSVRKRNRSAPGPHTA